MIALARGLSALRFAGLGTYRLAATSLYFLSGSRGKSRFVPLPSLARPPPQLSFRAGTERTERFSAFTSLLSLTWRAAWRSPPDLNSFNRNPLSKELAASRARGICSTVEISCLHFAVARRHILRPSAPLLYSFAFFQRNTGNSKLMATLPPLSFREARNLQPKT